jgi:hypothetical protein
MAHVRKDTKVAPPEWWKHLRPYNKRKLSRAERRAAIEEITDDILGMDEPSSKLKLSKKLKDMANLRNDKGEAVIPIGIYCYDDRGNCSYWDKAEGAGEQNDGYCWFMRIGDWMEEGNGLLWDQCKTCGKRMDDVPEGTLEVLK